MNNKKEMFSVRVCPKLLNDIRNIVFWTPGSTLGKVIEEALSDYIKNIKEKNGPIAQRNDALPYGRKCS